MSNAPHEFLPPEEVSELRRKLAQAVERICPPWWAQESEDLVQAALLRVIEIQKVREEGREFSSFYLRRAAYSVVVDEIRRRRRRALPSTGETEGEELHRLPEEHSPEEVSASRELGRKISECIGRLVSPRREAVSLHLLGHRINEVADLMGWTPKKAENLIYRGLVDLRKALKAAGVSSADVSGESTHSSVSGYPSWNELIGPFYTEAQAAELLGSISQMELSNLRQHSKLLALKTADGVFVYPAIQFDNDNHVLDGLPEVLKVLVASGVDDWSLAGWLVSDMSSLEGKSPIEWLREGGDRKPLLVLANKAAERFSR